ncbi:speckle targeted pip5k1a-regulated poly(a) polymerase [Plakobranchus ocellatus]|uniref:Speckle targeted pip5k1a-regulated poly(A) polymerase n=1 Tax=Plakobranchus ocellatus TaxID=259542 RepID=A0AAV4A271_9GAST|nr:speckle targeted pip5k1a-regulated poly(a) polymerase [Plakobranchus ocellatus]
MAQPISLSRKKKKSKQKTARLNLYSRVRGLLKETKSVEKGLQLITENFQLLPADFKKRDEIVRDLTEAFAPDYQGCPIHQFGSSINGFGMHGSDVDLFLDLNRPQISSKKTKIELRKLRKILTSQSQPGIFEEILLVGSRRCPIIKFTHKETGIECDLSLDNKLALRVSQLLQLYSSDLRVKQVVFALRVWAKLRRLAKVDEASGRSLLSSYALTFLALFYFMVCEPCPVIPAVCDLKKCIPGIKVEKIEKYECFVIPEGAELPPSENTKSSVELLQGFFKFYNQEISLDRDALILWDASRVPRNSLHQNSRYVNCEIGEMTMIDAFNLSNNVTANVNEKFCEHLASEMKQAAELSADWETKSSGPKVDASEGLAGLFRLIDLEADKKAKVRPVVGPMKGEQKNGEFHIILSITKATLNSGEFFEAARKKGLTPQQHWLYLAQVCTIKVLNEVFLAELHRVPSTSLNCDSTAVTNPALMTSSPSSASSTINSSTHSTVTTPAPHISLQCTCRCQVWEDRKERRTEMKKEFNLPLTYGDSLAFEKEVTQRLPKRQAGEPIVKFTCNLDEKASWNQRSQLLIKLCPSQSYLQKFKLFYKQFRSVIIQLNMFELNVTRIKNPYQISFAS